MTKLTNEQDRAAAQRWIDALRSGSYAQTCGALRRRRIAGTDAFCCLGVLADVELEGRWLTEDEGFRSGGVFRWADKGVNLIGTLAVQTSQAGAVMAVPWLSADVMQRVAAMNDRGASFDAIATFLEETLL